MNFGEAFCELLTNAEMGTPAIIRRKNWFSTVELRIGRNDRERFGVYLEKTFNGSSMGQFYPDQEDLFADNWEVFI